MISTMATTNRALKAGGGQRHPLHTGLGCRRPTHVFWWARWMQLKRCPFSGSELYMVGYCGKEGVTVRRQHSYPSTRSCSGPQHLLPDPRQMINVCWALAVTGAGSHGRSDRGLSTRSHKGQRQLAQSHH